MRTLFNKPIRKNTTEEFYPDQITVEQFSKRFGLKDDHPFLKDMKNLGEDNLKYIEKWAEMFLYWYDIEHEL